MAETPDRDDESPDEKPPEGGHTPPPKHSGAHSLEAFSTIQRQLAAIDFAGLTAAQRAVGSFPHRFAVHLSRARAFHPAARHCAEDGRMDGSEELPIQKTGDSLRAERSGLYQ